MSSTNRRHVEPDPNGGWIVRKSDASRSSGHFDAQREAMDRARTILQNDGGGELVIHNREGEIRDTETVAPGHEPSPSQA